ncbi:response regulator [Marispirochaeta aestuarii]|uniref:response regulator transcription factor n=1 Tax=Marispirochaeta aestuarii TaxID=1963862 RepID=UPI0029C89934|nr:response regulator [Marispirochaeta aestuarii]
MYKVLIADDELLVRVGLKTTIDWEGNGFTVTGEAKNGKEAIELFNQHNPDILLTDVGMPDMNGLQLIQELTLKKENLISIILTHHDDFNYAHQAINLGVIAYILKSNLTEENLLRHLHKATELLGPREKEKDDPESYDLHLIEKAIRGDQLEEQQVNTIKRIFFPNNRYQLVVMQFQVNSDNNIHPAEKILNFEKVITSISHQVFKDNNYTVIPVIHKNEAIYIFNMPGTTDFHSDDKKIKSIVYLLKKNIIKYLNLNIFTGISDQANSLRDLSSLYKKAHIACRGSFFDSDNITFFIDKAVDNDNNGHDIDIKELNLLLENKNNEGIQIFFQHHFQIIQSTSDTQSLISNFNALIEDLQIHAQKEQISGDNSLQYIRSESELFSRFYNVTDIIQYFTDHYTKYLETSGKRKSSFHNSHIIRKSMEYIRRHSAENISLQTVADYVEVSRSYLSFLFKQELGINFSTYMTEIRIERAKKLLVSSNMKIYEIAEKVGFDSPYYFSKVFKDTCGFTCKQYRSSHYSPEFKVHL